MSKLTSIRISDDQYAALDKLDRKISEVFRDGLARELSEHETGDLWIGIGVWKGWRLTTAHSLSSHGQPVFVGPDGVGRGSGDIG